MLVVDDDPRVRAGLIEALQAAGYAAVGCAEGLTAAELVRDIAPDLVVLDLRMPRTSGWDFLDTLRARPGRRRTPVLVVSAYLEPERQPEAAAGLNVVGWLAKPVDLAEFRRRVADAIGPAGGS